MYRNNRLLCLFIHLDKAWNHSLFEKSTYAQINMKIRLFIALDLPSHITTLLEGMCGSSRNIRPVKTEQLHLTLRFIGQVDEGLFYEVKQRLQEVNSSPLTLALQGVGRFPARGKARVIWVGITPIIEVARLRNRIDNQLSRCGIVTEKRKFSPHITLARLRNPSKTIISKFLTDNKLFQSPGFMINHFSLYSSHLTNKGAIHTTEASYGLS